MTRVPVRQPERRQRAGPRKSGDRLEQVLQTGAVLWMETGRQVAVAEAGGVGAVGNQGALLLGEGQLFCKRQGLTGQTDASSREGIHFPVPARER